MRFRIILVGVLTILMISPSAAGWLRLGDDAGGAVGRYLKEFAAARDSGERIVVDGTCVSACTLVLALIPRDRLCVTPRAVFGFHVAWTPDVVGRHVPSLWGTQTLFALYPQWVREWIAHAGGLSNRMLYLGGPELARMLASCS